MARLPQAKNRCSGQEQEQISEHVSQTNRKFLHVCMCTPAPHKEFFLLIGHTASAQKFGTSAVSGEFGDKQSHENGPSKAEAYILEEIRLY